MDTIREITAATPATNTASSRRPAASSRRELVPAPRKQREFHPPGVHGIEGLLGNQAWQALPSTVRTRFREPTLKVDYVGEFDIVRASIVGRIIAWVCQAIGTPVVPRTGERVAAVIHVGPVERGASWLREYRWPHGRTCQVHSTKVVSADGILVEELPAGLRMPLSVYEQRGVLHFVSTGYYFEFARRLKIPLPSWLSPGITHVEHADESKGWFRFTMTVTHPLFGEVFYQTGRFRAAGLNPSQAYPAAAVPPTRKESGRSWRE